MIQNLENSENTFQLSLPEIKQEHKHDQCDDYNLTIKQNLENLDQNQVFQSIPYSRKRVIIEPITHDKHLKIQNDKFISLSEQVNNVFSKRQQIEYSSNEMKPTIPQPFNFLIDKIKESKPKIIETSKEFCFKARKVPSYKFFEPVLSEKPLQIPNEFKLSTEIRGHSKSKQFQEELIKQKVVQQQLKKFQANPIPNYNELGKLFLNKNVTHIPTTTPKKFKLRTQYRSEIKPMSSLQIDEPIQQFKAHQAPDFNKIHSKLLNKSTSDVKEPVFKVFNLQSDKRATIRQIFDLQVQTKKIAEENDKRVKQGQKSIEDEQREQENLLNQKFKAQPIHVYKELEIQKSSKKLTVPQSPQFKSDARLQFKKMKN